jgi:hypothetical protein
MSDVTYNSKIDTWLIMLLGLALSAMLFRGLMSLRFATPYALLVLGVFALVVLILLLFCYPCRYTFKADHLLVQSGALRLRIDYADVTCVTPSRSLWLAPALSLQRVRIDHDGRSMLVSPTQRDRFIAELTARVAATRGTA